jgi:hypothetical protein
MNLVITGPNDGVVRKQRLVNEVNEAAATLTRLLKINRFKANIQIRLHKKILINGEAEGYCTAESARDITIDIALFSDWKSALAHEMVHAKQFIRKELSTNMDRWKKRKHVDNLEYMDQPWEREAYRLEPELRKLI